MKKYRKLSILILIIVIAFVLFIWIVTSAKDYTKKYVIKKVNITENYNKKKKEYYFTFNYKDKALNLLIPSKYRGHHGLIEEMEIVEKDNNFCFIPKSEELDLMPVCYENDEQVYYGIVGKELKGMLPKEYQKSTNNGKETNYQDIKIYNPDYTYLIWNYQDSFYYINKDTKKKITLFNKQTYKLSLVGYTKDYLVIPDYDSNYTFNKIYTISFKDGEQKEYKLDQNIYFDSYFIGYDGNKIYLVDNKESLMYEFNAKNGELEKVKSKILVNGKWEEKSIKTLVNQKTTFTYDTHYEYVLENNNLYLKPNNKDEKTLIVKNVSSVIRIKENEVFYLKDKDTLYSFDPINGEKRLLNYFEWNFNSEGMIYIN